jgi:hypothetical protein
MNELSDEALDAGHEAFYANEYQGGPTACSAAIRAAAPHLIAQAFEEVTEQVTSHAAGPDWKPGIEFFRRVLRNKAAKLRRDATK